MEQFIQLVTAGGPFAVTGLLAWLYFKEREAHDTTRAAFSKYRDIKEDGAVALTREVITGAAATTAAMNKIAEGAEQNRQFSAMVAEALTAIAVKIGRTRRTAK